MTEPHVIQYQNVSQIFISINQRTTLMNKIGFLYCSLRKKLKHKKKTLEKYMQKKLCSTKNYANDDAQQSMPIRRMNDAHIVVG